MGDPVDTGSTNPHSAAPLCGCILRRRRFSERTSEGHETSTRLKMRKSTVQTAQGFAKTTTNYDNYDKERGRLAPYPSEQPAHSSGCTLPFVHAYSVAASTTSTAVPAPHAHNHTFHNLNLHILAPPEPPTACVAPAQGYTTLFHNSPDDFQRAVSVDQWNVIVGHADQGAPALYTPNGIELSGSSTIDTTEQLPLDFWENIVQESTQRMAEGGEQHTVNVLNDPIQEFAFSSDSFVPYTLPAPPPAQFFPEFPSISFHQETFPPVPSTTTTPSLSTSSSSPGSSGIPSPAPDAWEALTAAQQLPPPSVKTATRTPRTSRKNISTIASKAILDPYVMNMMTCTWPGCSHNGLLLPEHPKHALSHVKSHFPGGATAWTCMFSGCKVERPFESLKGIMDHIQIVHLGWRFCCPGCARHFSLPGHVTTHVKKGECVLSLSEYTQRMNELRRDALERRMRR
ncbi:uncharacterized protein BXZ73DRAFT_82890 [Epithele typhae]|uniref:uncharacterized protein n=1 Tax=Epithele typhae TaxID=378194 RepID=UPI0020073CDF|nr:uncharacterized protein BXZ73DRAFT_82890 [Epithele typhae]KAH9911312.1 hypothetical protein BXZ73DRAFT_82890 [Epithele typhae]